MGAYPKPGPAWPWPGLAQNFYKVGTLRLKKCNKFCQGTYLVNFFKLQNFYQGRYIVKKLIFFNGPPLKNSGPGQAKAIRGQILKFSQLNKISLIF